MNPFKITYINQGLKLQQTLYTYPPYTNIYKSNIFIEQQ